MKGEKFARQAGRKVKSFVDVNRAIVCVKNVHNALLKSNSSKYVHSDLSSGFSAHDFSF